MIPFPPPARVFTILASAAALSYPKVDVNVRIIAVVILVALYVLATSVIEHAKHKWGPKA